MFQVWPLALASIGLSAIAQLLMKMGMAELRTLGLGGLSLLTGAAANPLVISGFAAYGVGAVLWLLVLSRTELSVAYPLVSTGFVLVALMSWLFLGEHLSPARLGAISLIIAGVVLMGFTAK